MNNLELLCPIHNQKIFKISQTLSQNNSYARCGECKLDNQSFKSLDEFIQLVKSQKEQIKKNESLVMEKINSVQSALIACIENYKSQFNQQISSIINSINAQPREVVKDFTGKIPYDENQPSLECLETTCRTLFSTDVNNSIDSSTRSLPNFNIENVQISKYFRKTIEQFVAFIKLSQYYSQLIRDCLNSIINENDNLEYDQQIKQQVKSTDRINVMALSNYKDNTLFAIGYPREISLNQIINEKTKEIQKIQINYNQQNLLLSDDSKYLISIDDNSCLHIYKNQDLKFTEESRIYFAEQQRSLKSVIMSSNNEQILIAAQKSIYSIQYNQIQKLKSENEKILKYQIEEDGLDGHIGNINQISLNQNEDQMISCCNDKLVILWNLYRDKENGSFKWTQQLKKKFENEVTSCCFIDNDQFIVQCQSDRYLRLFQKSQQNNYQEKQKIQLDSITLYNLNYLQMQYDISKKVLFVLSNDILYLIYRQNNQRFIINQRIHGKFLVAKTKYHNKVLVFDQKENLLQFYSPKSLQKNKQEKEKYRKLFQI